MGYVFLNVEVVDTCSVLCNLITCVHVACVCVHVPAACVCGHAVYVCACDVVCVCDLLELVKLHTNLTVVISLKFKTNYSLHAKIFKKTR